MAHSVIITSVSYSLPVLHNLHTLTGLRISVNCEWLGYPEETDPEGARTKFYCSAGLKLDGEVRTSKWWNS